MPLENSVCLELSIPRITHISDLSLKEVTAFKVGPAMSVDGYGGNCKLTFEIEGLPAQQGQLWWCKSSRFWAFKLFMGTWESSKELYNIGIADDSDIVPYRDFSVIEENKKYKGLKRSLVGLMHVADVPILRSWAEQQYRQLFGSLDLTDPFD